MVSLMFEGLVTQSSQGGLNVHLSALLLMPLSRWFQLPLWLVRTRGQIWPMYQS